ncbi:MAG: ketoacyl-ACP synthase III [Lachnospiraceae bacterium]|nr:ketoacyl-ACP synthase III [Candidatus Merdinaster equi]
MRILGTGSTAAKKIVTNDDLAKTMETSDEWIRERTGIAQRHVAEADESPATLGAEASRRAIEMAKLSAEDIDLILVATASSMQRVPSISCQIQAIIGAANAACIDVNAACAGFMTALTMADAYLKAGAFNKVLVIGTETLSDMVDWTDRTSCILFGDGAGAVVVTAGGNDLIYSLGADGTKGDALSCQIGAGVVMDGKEVYRFATRTVPICMKDAMDKAGITPADIDVFLLHQANIRIIEAIAKSMKEPMEKFPVNIANYGNMSSASIPVLLDEQVRAGKINAGDRIIMSGFGAGLTYGACILVWS